MGYSYLVCRDQPRGHPSVDPSTLSGISPYVTRLPQVLLHCTYICFCVILVSIAHSTKDCHTMQNTLLCCFRMTSEDERQRDSVVERSLSSFETFCHATRDGNCGTESKCDSWWPQWMAGSHYLVLALSRPISVTSHFFSQRKTPLQPARVEVPLGSS